MTRVAILGSGMAGLGAAHRLMAEGVEPVLYDRNDFPGGHTTSFVLGEGRFVFDEGPHVSFTPDPRVQRLFADAVGGEYEDFATRVDNYWRGYRIKHPAQVNLHGLPTDLVVRILCEFAEVHARGDGGPVPEGVETYEDWLVASFGRTFAETFPMEYGRKYHTCVASEMTLDWIGQRLYRPDLEEVFRGALTPATPDVHYIKRFRYPTRGGFVSYVHGLLGDAEVRLGHEVVGIDPSARELAFRNGRAAGYDRVMSSIPLPDLIPMVRGAPAEVREAAARLSCTTCVLVNVALDREDVSEAHWSYFYDRDVFFTRLSFPHMLSPHNAPPGTGTIQAECYYSDKYRPLDRSPEACVAPVLRDLRRCGLIREDDRILLARAHRIPYANVVFDHDRAPALATVHGFLDDVGIGYAGRYGDWGYYWTDDSFRSGERAAQRVLDETGHRPWRTDLATASGSA